MWIGGALQELWHDKYDGLIQGRVKASAVLAYTDQTLIAITSIKHSRHCHVAYVDFD